MALEHADTEPFDQPVCLCNLKRATLYAPVVCNQVPPPLWGRAGDSGGNVQGNDFLIVLTVQGNCWL